MHQGELSDLPGGPKPSANPDQICCPDEKSDDSSVITGNDFRAPISLVASQAAASQQGL